MTTPRPTVGDEFLADEFAAAANADLREYLCALADAVLAAAAPVAAGGSAPGDRYPPAAGASSGPSPRRAQSALDSTGAERGAGPSVLDDVDRTDRDEPRVITGDTADEQRANAAARFDADEALP